MLPGDMFTRAHQLGAPRALLSSSPLKVSVSGRSTGRSAEPASPPGTYGSGLHVNVNISYLFRYQARADVPFNQLRKRGVLRRDEVGELRPHDELPRFVALRVGLRPRRIGVEARPGRVSCLAVFECEQVGQ